MKGAGGEKAKLDLVLSSPCLRQEEFPKSFFYFFKSFLERFLRILYHGEGLSKDPEQCCSLTQQLFKAGGRLPEKGSLDLELWEKAGQTSPHGQESLDEN